MTKEELAAAMKDNADFVATILDGLAKKQDKLGYTPINKAGDTLTGVLPPLSGRAQCEGGVALVPQSFRPAFRWRVSDVVLMGRARHVDLFAQPDEEDARRVEQALAGLAGAFALDLRPE